MAGWTEMPEESRVPEKAKITFWMLHLERVKSAEPIPCPEHQREMNSFRGHSNFREGKLCRQGQFFHHGIEFQVKIEFVG